MECGNPGIRAGKERLNAKFSVRETLSGTRYMLSKDIFEALVQRSIWKRCYDKTPGISCFHCRQQR